jgi:hypothetical protein
MKIDEKAEELRLDEKEAYNVEETDSHESAE